MKPRTLLVFVAVALWLAGCAPIGTPPQPPQWPQITWVGKDERKNEIVYTYEIQPLNVNWNPIQGNYIFAKFVHHEWVPVYTGETANFRYGFADGYRSCPPVLGTGGSLCQCI